MAAFMELSWGFHGGSTDCHEQCHERCLALTSTYEYPMEVVVPCGAATATADRGSTFGLNCFLNGVLKGFLSPKSPEGQYFSAMWLSVRIIGLIGHFWDYASSIQHFHCYRNPVLT